MNSIFSLNPMLFQFEKIVIFGAGKTGRKLKNRLYINGIDIYAFIDSDKDKTNMLCDGKNVLDINWLKNNHAACVIPLGYQEEIYRICKENKLDKVFLDNQREKYELVIFEEPVHLLYVMNLELLERDLYILGTGKYSRRLFILCNLLNINMNIKGFLKFSSDKPCESRRILGQNVFSYEKISDKNIAILVPKSISNLHEYSRYSEKCWYEFYNG